MRPASRIAQDPTFRKSPGQAESRAVRRSACGGYKCTAGLASARHEQPLRLGIGLRALSNIRNLGFQSPIPQIVRIESDAEKISRKESKFRSSHSNDTDDDAVCSSNDPALPLFLSDEDRRENSQNARQIIKPDHFPPLPPSSSLFIYISFAV